MKTRHRTGLGLGIATLVLCFLAAETASCGEPPDSGVKPGFLDDELKRNVNEAIRRGVRYLLDRQAPDGAWRETWSNLPGHHRFASGETALALAALMACGVSRFEVPVGKGFRVLENEPPQTVYEAAVALLAYAERGCTIDRRGNRKVRPPESPSASRHVDLCTKFLLENRTGRIRESNGGEMAPWRIWGYPSCYGDHSNTAFAVLGLKAASELGKEVPEKTWHAIVAYFPEVQERDGPEVPRWECRSEGASPFHTFHEGKGERLRARGWGYRSGPAKKGSATGSMTCAGILSLRIALRQGNITRESSRTRAEKAVRDGMAWMDQHWNVETNPDSPGNAWHACYLFLLDRAARETSSLFVGRHDWYGDGARHLLSNQKSSGAWEEPGGPGTLCRTCFALLFLAQPTLPSAPYPSPEFFRERNRRSGVEEEF